MIRTELDQYKCDHCGWEGSASKNKFCPFCQNYYADCPKCGKPLSIKKWWST